MAPLPCIICRQRKIFIGSSEALRRFFPLEQKISSIFPNSLETVWMDPAWLDTKFHPQLLENNHHNLTVLHKKSCVTTPYEICDHLCTLLLTSNNRSFLSTLKGTFKKQPNRFVVRELAWSPFFAGCEYEQWRPTLYDGSVNLPVQPSVGFNSPPSVRWFKE